VKSLLISALLLVSVVSAFADRKLNIVVDPLPAGVVGIKLYNGATLITTAVGNAVTATNFPDGAFVLTATAYAADGRESPKSAPLNVPAAVIAPPVITGTIVNGEFVVTMRFPLPVPSP
jgi:hypothetical protein